VAADSFRLSGASGASLLLQVMYLKVSRLQSSVMPEHELRLG